MDRGVQRAINYYSRVYNLDPKAVAAISMVEGGGRRNARGDFMGGRYTSFGPFQLHEGGALPRGRNAAWAGSDAGIRYALSRMASSGAAGLRGQAAVAAISRNFERPADPNAEIRRALGYYGRTGTLSADSGPANVTAGGPVRNSAPAAPVADTRNALIQYVMANNANLAAGQEAVNPLAFIPLESTSGGAQTAPAASPTPPKASGGPVSFTGQLRGEDPNFTKKLHAAVAAVGGTKVRINSGERSPSHNSAVGGVSHSNHLPDARGYAHAVDGEVYIPGRGWVPLGVALKRVAPRFGLRSGDQPGFYNGGPDYVHVDDGYNQR